MGSSADVKQVTSKKIEQGDATREALVAAARELFGTQGYAAASLDEIVRSAGVTKGALYHHFSGKQQLFHAVFKMVKKELSREAFPLDVANDDVWSDLVSRCRAFIEKHTEPRVQRIVLIDARSVLSWDDWHRIDSEYGVVMLRGALRRAMHRGIIDPQPLHSLALMLGGALAEGCILVATAENREGAITEAVGIIERLLEGLRPRRASV
jgi:AcrR family transcriptional regulator